MENLEILIPIIAPLIGGVVVSIKKWIDAKTKISDIKNFFIELEDALKDDKITEEEFRKVFYAAKRIINQ